MANFLASGERLRTRVVVTTPPSLPVIVTVAEAKKHAQVTASGDDEHIQLLINAAVEKFEQATGRQLWDASYTLYLDTFPRVIKLPFVPVDSVTSVKYYDTAASLQTLATSKYQVTNGGLDAITEIFSGISDPWPSTESGRIDAVEVLFKVGYGATQGDIPDMIQHCIREMVAETYINRLPTDKVGASTINIPMHAIGILESYGVFDW